MKKLLAGLFAAALFGGGTWIWAQEKDLFESLDANKDGVLTADEVKGEEKKTLFERALRKGDKNGDKKLTKEEFQAALKEPAPDRPTDAPRDQPRRPEGLRGEGQRPDAKMFEEMFNKWDANSDGKLTEDEVPEGQRERFKQALERFDDDGDKAITKEQAPRVMMFLMQRGGPPDGPRPDQRMAEQLFSQWDANKDGKLTADEVPERQREVFERVLQRVNEKGDKALTKEQFARVAMAFMAPGGRPPFGPGAMPPLAVIRALDSNGDGELSKEEIENASKALATLDKNGDGKLSREELMPGLAGGFPGRPGEGRPDGERRPDQPRPEGRPDARPGEGRPAEGRPAVSAEQIRARLKEMDTNGDGKISKEEAQGRIKESFDRIDANSDGFVDEAEIKAAFQRAEGRRPEGRRPDGDRPEGRRPTAEKNDKPKDKDKE